MALITEARRYSVADLLSLRTSLSKVSCLVKNINKHPEIASIFRIPEEAFRRPEHFSCTSAHLADITNKPAARQLNRKNITDSSEQSESRSVVDFGRVQDHRQGHWTLRRRDNSDRSSQPHSAPTGLAAQQSENFQKFYRAVVSPSHVRVTAGGRIVPNTRSPIAHSSEGNGEKIALDSRPLGLIPWAQDVSPAHPQAPGPFWPPHNFPPPPPHPVAVGFPIMSAPPTGFYGAGPPEQYPKASLGSQVLGVKTEPIKISPPGQFDQTKPFTYNGQIVYPVPYGLQPPPNAVPVPMGMLGNPNFFSQTTQQTAGGLMPSVLPFQFANPPNPMAFAAAQHSSMLATPSATPGSETYIPYMPMPGLVAPSDYMKYQVQTLQSHFDYIGTLLANDKHRIDKAQLEHQRSGLLAQISHLESLLQIQLRGDGSTSNTGHRGDVSGGSYEEYKSTRSSSGSVQAEAVSGDAPQIDDNVTARSDLRPKSKLTIAAAMAPPFQPRSRTTAAPVVESVQSKQSMPMSRSTSAIDNPEPEETNAEIAARLMASSTTDWLRPGFKFGADKGYNPKPYPGEMARQSPQHNHLNITQHSSNYHQALLANPNYPVPSTEAVPYLIGTLPAGLNAQAANANDLVYSRPLTVDEVRARYLYWGKAPRSVQSGLPKFDGKDFYPPSPIKKAASLASARAIETQANKDSVSEKLYPFRLHSNDIAFLKPIPQPVFTDVQNRGTSEQTSLSSGQGLPDNLAQETGRGRNHIVQDKGIPTELDFSKLFMEKGCPGYRSPSPKPSVVRFSAEQDEAPVTPQNATFFDDVEDNVDDAKSDDSWQPANLDAQRHKSKNSDVSVDSVESGTEKSESTVDIKLSSHANGDRLPSHLNKSFDERVENFKNADEQTMFLQKMLKNEGRAGTALSGTISSTTAQGCLPQYRGTAAASLAPAEYVPYKAAPSTATNSQAENRPVDQDKYDRHSNPASDTMSATEYLRYVSAKAYETEKSIIDRGWNANTTAFGPVRAGEEW
ncbi:hypothetical protein VTL71DRAFT_14312 [Oculimacula yallundae]|uniref:Uncharacterized protein n=1 Tax=Oculimacula yallundae TaxID=86028 RepID=A0ABR4CI41_9HELO